MSQPKKKSKVADPTTWYDACATAHKSEPARRRLLSFALKQLTIEHNHVANFLNLALENIPNDSLLQDFINLLIKHPHINATVQHSIQWRALHPNEQSFIANFVRACAVTGQLLVLVETAEASWYAGISRHLRDEVARLQFSMDSPTMIEAARYVLERDYIVRMRMPAAEVQTASLVLWMPVLFDAAVRNKLSVTDMNRVGRALPPVYWAYNPNTEYHKETKSVTGHAGAVNFVFFMASQLAAQRPKLVQNTLLTRLDLGPLVAQYLTAQRGLMHEIDAHATTMLQQKVAFDGVVGEIETAQARLDILTPLLLEGKPEFALKQAKRSFDLRIKSCTLHLLNVRTALNNVAREAHNALLSSIIAFQHCVMRKLGAGRTIPSLPMLQILEEAQHIGTKIYKRDRLLIAMDGIINSCVNILLDRGE